jgi:uroporphyrinogen decarboxylase
MMTPRERVLKTLRFEEPDRVPFFEQGVDSANASNILGREAITGGGNARFRSMEAGWEGPDAYAEAGVRARDDWAELIEVMDMDAVTGAWTGGGVPSARIDELTFRFDDPATDTWTIQRFSPDSDTLYEVDSSLMSEGMPALERVMAYRIEHYQTPTPNPDAHTDVRWRLERFHPQRAVAGSSGLSIPNRPAVWLEAIASRPDLVEAHLDMQCEQACAAIEAQAQLGVDFIWGGGDLASTRGPLYSPAHFHRFMLPRLKKMTEVCDRHGLVYFFRTDGWLWPIADDLFVNSGVTGYGEIDMVAGMDLAEIREKLPHLVLWGNVDCAGALVSGTPEDVAAETRACIDKAAVGGGYILGSSNVIHSKCRTDNFLAMVETCREYGVY